MEVDKLQTQILRLNIRIFYIFYCFYLEKFFLNTWTILVTLAWVYFQMDVSSLPNINRAYFIKLFILTYVFIFFDFQLFFNCW